MVETIVKSSPDNGVPWFRGQADAEWLLETTLDRFKSFKSDHERLLFYTDLMNRFKEEIIGIGSNDYFLTSDALELLARHHGLPSMLLDWTKSPFVAAYFAFEEAIKRDVRKVAIWGINQLRIDAEMPIDLIQNRSLLRFNARALEQAGVFMRINTSQSAETVLGPAVVKYELPARSRHRAARACNDEHYGSQPLSRLRRCRPNRSSNESTPGLTLPSCTE